MGPFPVTAVLAIALLAVCSSFAPVLPARFDSFHTFASPWGSTVHGNVKHSSTLYSHMPSTRSSHLIKRTLPRQFAKPAKSRRTTSSIRIEEAAQIAGERAGQIKSNSKLRRATKADLEANSLQDNATCSTCCVRWRRLFSSLAAYSAKTELAENAELSPVPALKRS